MYRAVALKAVRAGVAMTEHDSLGRIAREAHLELSGRGRGPILLDGEDVSLAIREADVSDAASVMSTVPEVRRALVEQQRGIGSRESCVMEGRDIGTVVFPDADLKIYLVASIETRAMRRYLQTVGGEVPAGPLNTEARAAVDEIAASIAERDRRDSTRTDSPLRKADDAVEVDTTSLTVEGQVARVIELAVERGAVLPADGGEARRV